MSFSHRQLVLHTLAGMAALGTGVAGQRLHSADVRQRWLPPMQRLEVIGALGLTEPEVGSGVARGLTTTARRDGDTWVLNGQKKWIGNAKFADVTVI